MMSVVQTEQDPRTGADQAVGGLGGKYLTFHLAGEQFGIQILKVREIIGRMRTTPVPGSPECIRGVINLRGKIVAVMDLRRRLGFPDGEEHARNCIVVTEVPTEEGTVEMGLLVDAVSEVLDIDGGEIEPPPSLGPETDTSCLLGMAKSGSEVKLLLDIGTVVLDSAAALAMADSVA